MEKEWLEAICQMQPFPFLTETRQRLFDEYDQLPHYRLERQTMRPFYPKQVFDFGEEDERVYNFVDSDNQLMAVTHDGDMMVEQMPRELADRGVKLTSLFEALFYAQGALSAYVGTLMVLDTKESAFHYMMMNHGLLLYIPDNTVLDEPIVIEALESESRQTLVTHVVMIIGDNCRVHIHDHHQGSGDRYMSHVVETFIGRNSHVHYDHLDDSQTHNRHYVERHFKVARDSHLDLSLVSVGNQDETERVSILLDEQGAEANIRVAMTSRKTQNKGINVVVHHHAPHTHSQLVQHGVVFDKATLIANADSVIAEHTPQATAHQSTKIMMMTDHGKADANPMLEIHHNDVKASHAASMNQMDDELLYYMQLRGLSKEEAQALYTAGFLKVVMPAQWHHVLEGGDRHA